MKVFYGARLFDGERLHDDCALVVEGRSIQALVPVRDRPRGGEQVDLGSGILSPGFIDWQINGGGGVLFNADPDRRRHRRNCSRASPRRRDRLPADGRDRRAARAKAALAAARGAQAHVPGALGIHVEGPFIDPRRKGVHPPEFIRPMEEEDATP